MNEARINLQANPYARKNRNDHWQVLVMLSMALGRCMIFLIKMQKRRQHYRTVMIKSFGITWRSYESA